jgi:hypothetical protein
MVYLNRLNYFVILIVITHVAVGHMAGCVLEIHALNRSIVGSVTGSRTAYIYLLGDVATMGGSLPQPRSAL